MYRIAMSFVFLAVLGAGCAETGTWTTPAPAPAPAVEEVGTTTPEEAAAPEAVPEQADSDAPTPAPAAAPKPAVKKSAPAPSPATGYVTITDTAFSPQVMAVQAGASVVWTNKGTKNQTVHSDGSNLYDSGNIPPSGSYKRTFEYPGSYVYYSASNPTLKGTVVVR